VGIGRYWTLAHPGRGDVLKRRNFEDVVFWVSFVFGLIALVMAIACVGTALLP